MAKSFVKTQVRLPKVPCAAQKYSAELTLPAAEQRAQCCPGRCGGCPELSQLWVRWGEASSPAWGALPPSLTEFRGLFCKSLLTPCPPWVWRGALQCPDLLPHAQPKLLLGTLHLRHATPRHSWKGTLQEE